MLQDAPYTDLISLHHYWRQMFPQKGIKNLIKPVKMMLHTLNLIQMLVVKFDDDTH